MSNIIVVTAYDDGFAPVGDFCARSIKKYCEKNGYDYQIHRDGFDPRRSPEWYKIPIIRDHLETHEYVLWVDADAIIVNMDEKIERFIHPNCDITLSQDIHGINFGVVLFKRSELTKIVLNNIYNSWVLFRNETSPEQTAFIHHYNHNTNNLKEITHFYPQNIFNSFIYSLYNMNYPAGEFNPDQSFILHLPGLDNLKRRQILSAYYQDLDRQNQSENTLRHKQETSLIRDEVLVYCQGKGIDLGCGYDPITDDCIAFEAHIPEGADPARYVKGDARQMEFEANYFDYVYSSHLLEDFPDTEAVLAEWFRVLKPGGYMILYLPIELKYREHCKKHNQPYNLAHSIEEMSLDYMIKKINKVSPETKFIKTIREHDNYSFLVVVQKEIGKAQVKPALHSGDMGDIVYSIPVAKRLGVKKYILNTGHKLDTRFTQEGAELIKPLLESQGFEVEIADIKPYPQVNIDCYNFDITRFDRRIDYYRTDLITIPARAMGVSSANTMVWLQNIKPRKVADVIINRTARYHNPVFDWARLLYAIGSSSVGFIGTRKEYDAFTSEGDVSNFVIEYIPTADLKEAAEVIAGAGLFIGNQSVCYAIAEGLKIKRIQETCQYTPNCIFPAPNAAFIRTLYDWNVVLGHYKRKMIEGKATLPANEISTKIIIPMKNNAEHTIACVNSILNSKNAYSKYKVLIIANNTVDSEYDKIEQAFKDNGDKVYIYNFKQQIYSYADACNINVHVGNCILDYVMFLNNDTIVTDGFLDAMLKEFDHDPLVGIVSPAMLYPGTDLIQSVWGVTGMASNLPWNVEAEIIPYPEHRFKKLSSVQEAAESRNITIAAGGCMLIRPQLTWGWEEILNSIFVNGGEDVDLCYRTLQKGYKIRYCADAIVYHHESVTNIEPDNKRNLHILRGLWNAYGLAQKTYQQTQADLARDRQGAMMYQQLLDSRKGK